MEVVGLKIRVQGPQINAEVLKIERGCSRIFILKRVTCKTLGDISLEMKVFLGQISFVFVNNAECINIHSHQK